MSDIRIERLTTTGTMRIGFEIENNVWLVGNDDEVIVIDAAHDAAAIALAVGERQVHGILLTHGHEDHVNAAVELAQRIDAQLFLHPADLFLWNDVHNPSPDVDIVEGAQFTVGDVTLTTLHTPGHTPGSVSFVAESLGVVFSGDTLFHGGPGATRWEYSSFEQIITSIQEKLFTLNPALHVLPGHGQATTLQAETEQLQQYVDRGW